MDFSFQGQIEIGNPVKAVSPNQLTFLTVSWIFHNTWIRKRNECNVGPEKSESKSGRASESRALIEIWIAAWGCGWRRWTGTPSNASSPTLQTRLLIFPSCTISTWQAEGACTTLAPKGSARWKEDQGGTDLKYNYNAVELLSVLLLKLPSSKPFAQKMENLERVEKSWLFPTTSLERDKTLFYP